MSKVRLLLVGEHPIYLDGIRAILRDTPDLEVIDEVWDVETAVRAASESCPEVILVDVQHPLQHSTEIIARILSGHPDARILALVVSQDSETLSRLIRAGASGYVQKNVRGPELTEAILRMASGEPVIDPDVAQQVLADYRKLIDRTSDSDQPHFSARDIQILGLLAAGASNRAISENLYLSEQTVKNVLSDLYRRLSAANRTEAVSLAIRAGLIPHYP